MFRHLGALGLFSSQFSIALPWTGMADLTLSEKFKQLCGQAARETDSQKLLELTQAINRIFDEREKANQDLAKRASAA